MLFYALGLCIFVAIAVVAHKMLQPSARPTDVGSSTTAKADLELLDHQPTNIFFQIYNRHD